jgi:hypothetical protein
MVPHAWCAPVQKKILLFSLTTVGGIEMFDDAPIKDRRTVSAPIVGNIAWVSVG